MDPKDSQDTPKSNAAANFGTTSDVSREAEEALRLYQALQDSTATQLRRTTSLFGKDMKLFVEVHGTNTTLSVVPSGDVVIGRKDSNMVMVAPEIDLAPFAAYQMGVSRQHALIRMENDVLHLYDLGSRNGTYVNAKRALPNQPCKLHDGDEIRLGKMILRIYFRKDSMT
jgi:pSer/pThr/pTyr-binding forkhead associated (FHA) protein